MNCLLCDHSIEKEVGGKDKEDIICKDHRRLLELLEKCETNDLTKGEIR